MTGGLGHNGMTRDEWLYAILNSGEVTRISQHLALVIYHLADPATNTARLSARDLERITGWGRTAIIEHLDELEIYVRVKWGQGRAKALFELQGVIAEAVKPLKIAREADTMADTRTEINSSVHQPDTTTVREMDTKSYVHEADARPDTRADTKPCGEPDGHKNGVQSLVVSASRTQTPIWGDYRGVNLDSSNPESLSQGGARETVANETPPPFIIHPDGSFSGTAFEHFTAAEVAAFRTTYPFLDIPAELAAADQVLAVAFERENVEFGSRDRMARLHQYLNSMNRKASSLVQAAAQAAKSKADGKDDQCWFDEHRIVVANGFRNDLLALVGGDEKRLELTLIKTAKDVPVTLRGVELRKAVHGHFARHADWDAKDERKTKAIENRVVGKPAPGAASLLRRY